ncbi:ROK family transcriptional regulator [Arthrobacter celericrescens]|uniref:ROK family transcriptional regulator n=1 Tax=Arthrobacter celericrescens TaxID=2320851 RepID=UPI000EA1ED67|nr:ROK family transcriptional regulator [Arthrobacter celericrescens]
MPHPPTHATVGKHAAGRVGDVRRQNLALVLGGIHRNGGVTRARLAADIGLTKASVSSLVADLLGAGLVREDSIARDGERGRPGTGLVLNPARGALAAEISVDHLAVGVLDLAGDLLFQESVERRNRGSAPADLLPLLVEMTGRAAIAAAASGVELLGGELTVPGLVDAERNMVLAAPNLGWTGVDLSTELPGLLPGAPFGVSLSNEANSAALAELWHGHGATFSDFLYVSGEVGVGGGLVIDSRLYAGPQGHAGEIGHMVVHPDGPRCACGGRGCLEAFAGQDAIYSAAGIEQEGRRMERLLERLADGDEGAVSAVERAGQYLGIAVASTARVANISAVVLGGHFAALEDWIAPALCRSLERYAPGLIPAGNVAFSGLGQTAALVGAAATTVRRILGRPYELIS